MPLQARDGSFAVPGDPVLLSLPGDPARDGDPARLVASYGDGTAEVEPEDGVGDSWLVPIDEILLAYPRPGEERTA